MASGIYGFLSTLSLRRATPRCRQHLRGRRFLSTLSLRRATQGGLFQCPDTGISIHALLAESDLNHGIALIPHQKFLSTLSLRRATAQHPVQARQLLDFYPRSPCGERPVAFIFPTTPQVISIHALLAESDKRPPIKVIVVLLFLSTLSLRRATLIFAARYPAIRVFLSTLSLRRATPLFAI